MEVGDIDIEAVIEPQSHAFSNYIDVFSSGGYQETLVTRIDLVSGDGLRFKREDGLFSVNEKNEPVQEPVCVEVVRLQRDAPEFARKEFNELASIIASFAKVQMQS